MVKDLNIKEALTFDDVLLEPAKSDLIPSEVDITTRLTKNIPLRIPILSAAMDTVTDSRMAIALAQQGGMGIIHKNMTIEEQADEVDRVKRSESGMIVNPITMSPDQKISEAVEAMKKYKISGLPITSNGKLVGILTAVQPGLLDQFVIDKPGNPGSNELGRRLANLLEQRLDLALE